jgi:hypothetical protein
MDPPAATRYDPAILFPAEAIVIEDFTAEATEGTERGIGDGRIQIQEAY